MNIMTKALKIGFIMLWKLFLFLLFLGTKTFELLLQAINKLIAEQLNIGTGKK